MDIKSIIISHKKVVIASIVTIAIVAVGAFAGISISSYNKMIAEQKAIDEKAQTAYSAYVEEFDSITSNITDSPTHDELVEAIAKLSDIKIDEESITLHDGSLIEDNKLAKDISDSIDKYKGMLIDSYNTDINAATVDESTATKEDLITAVEALTTIKGSIESDKETIDVSVDTIIEDIDSKISTYNSKIDELNKAEEAAQAAASQNSYGSGGSGDGSSSSGSNYSGNGSSSYSGGSYSGSSSYSGGYSGGSYSGSSNDYPESEGWHHTDNYGGMWVRPATPEEETRAIAEAQADGSYTNYD